MAQVFKEIGSEAPNVDSAATLKSFLIGCQRMKEKHENVVLAYHDRSDGGLFTTIAEMSFAGRVGVEVFLDTIPGSENPLAALFNEELGAVVQVRRSDVATLHSVFSNEGFPVSSIHAVGTVKSDQTFTIVHNSAPFFSSTREELQSLWAETSYQMQKIRDDPISAKQENSLIKDKEYRGIHYDLKFSYLPTQVYPHRPKVAILREQGVNGQVEMAWAFSAAGFTAIDVHMSDIISGAVSLTDFRGLAACGGFSYGDVLGAGNGWANSVLLHDKARKEFEGFFQRKDAFALAVCNGCQFLSHLRQIIPGAESWPDLKANKSERFEGRTSMVEIVDNDVTRSSVFFRDMAGSRLPVAVAHGEGRVSFKSESQKASLIGQNLVAVRYIDSQGKPTEVYPLNPNGSPEGITGIQTPDGRILALMPHPERVTTIQSNSWYPKEMLESWHGTGPWFRMFQNARQWVG